MPSSSKRKGSSFERQIVNIAKEKGLDAVRAYASNGEALGHHAEVDLVIGGVRCQAKIRKKLPNYISEAEEAFNEDRYDALIIRQDRGQSLAVIDFDKFLDLIINGYL